MMAEQAGPLASTLLALAMLAVAALLWGGWRAFRRGGDRRKAALMLACAVVIFGNVLIWTL